MRLPNGQPFRIEFLDFQPSLQPHTQPFQANLKRLGIDAFSRIVDAAQYQRRMDEYDFDMASRNLVGSSTPGDSLRIVYGSECRQKAGLAQHRRDRRSRGGCADRARSPTPSRARSSTSPAVPWTGFSVRAIIGCPCGIGPANGWPIGTSSRAPRRKPRLASGAPGTWWYDAEKAKRIGRG